MARTTSYRRYRDRDEMLTAVLEPIAQPTPPAPQADPDQDMQWVVERSRRAVDHGIGRDGLAALVDQCRQSTVPDAVSRGLPACCGCCWCGTAAPLAEVIAHHQARGDMPVDLEVQTFLDCVVGAYLAEQPRSGHVTTDWTDRVTRSCCPPSRP
ncbi:TetR family transcriptional regulator [Rhodococcus opacus]|nr:hypothetical protein [Rhodococcus opacus]ELB91078.1 TetR family transcriptional regulator [Rhodococcus wratislaviensis IFP 2016]MDX5962777.1 TetR family transcriptional regulator [Rhodococcus opacus]CAG7637991.1 hypothetical protein E143388_07952 [Rhodococcus opacus]